MDSVLYFFKPGALADGHSSLYTVYLRLVEASDSAVIFRLLSFLTTCLSYVLIYLLSRSRPFFEQCLLFILFSFSYVFVLYGSEARGYSPMLALALLALYSLRQGKNLLFAIASIVGFFFHYSFLQFYVAVCLYGFHQVYQGRLKFFTFLRLHSLPAVVIASTYFFLLRHLPQASGPLASYLDSVVALTSVSMGGPLVSGSSWGATTLALIVAVFAFTLLHIEIFLQAKDKNPEWLFNWAVIFMVPASILYLLEPRVLLPRYFLLSALFAYFLLASFLRRLYRATAVGKLLTVLLFMAFLCGQGLHLNRFLQYGRGQYKVALSSIVNEAGSNKAIVGGDFSFRDAMLIDYYQRRLEGGERLEYRADLSKEGAAGVEWYLRQSQDLFLEAPLKFAISGTEYQLQGVFPHAGLSGWTYFVYRKSSAG